jgi:hypothetical protein
MRPRAAGKGRAGATTRRQIAKSRRQRGNARKRERKKRSCGKAEISRSVFPVSRTELGSSIGETQFFNAKKSLQLTHFLLSKIEIELGTSIGLTGFHTKLHPKSTRVRILTPPRHRRAGAARGTTDVLE